MDIIIPLKQFEESLVLHSKEIARNAKQHQALIDCHNDLRSSYNAKEASDTIDFEELDLRLTSLEESIALFGGKLSTFIAELKSAPAPTPAPTPAPSTPTPRPVPDDEPSKKVQTRSLGARASALH